MDELLFDLEGYVKNHEKFSLKRPLDFEVLRLVLKKKKSQRTDQDLLYIKSALMQIPFLKRMLDSIESEHIQYTLLRQTQIKEFNSGRTIFEEDHIGKYLYVLLKGSVYLIRKKDKEIEEPIRSPTKKNTIIGREATDFLLGDEEKLASHPLHLHLLPKLISRVASMSKMEAAKGTKLKKEPIVATSSAPINPANRNRRMALTPVTIEPIEILSKQNDGNQGEKKPNQDEAGSESNLDSSTQLGAKDQPGTKQRDLKKPSIKEELSDNSDDEKTKKEQENDKEQMRKILMARRLNRPKGLTKKYIPLFSMIKMQKTKTTNVEEHHIVSDDELDEEEENLAALTEPMLKEAYPSYKLLARIYAPDYFGEIGFQDSTMRQATAIAKEYCFMILLPSLQYHTALQEYFNNQNKELLRLFKTLPLTKSWPIWSLSGLAKEAKLVTFEKGQNFFTQGDEAKHLFIIKNGEVQITKEIILKCPEEIGSNAISAEFKNKQFQRSRLVELNRIWKDQKIKNQVLKVAILSVGEIVGDLDNNQYKNVREYTATCVSETCEAYRIRTKDFLDYSKDPDIFYREIVSENPKRKWRDGVLAGLKHTTRAMYNIKQEKIDREKEQEWVERIDKSIKELKENPIYGPRLIELKGEVLYHKFDLLKAYNDAADKWKQEKEKTKRLAIKAANVQTSKDEQPLNAYMKSSVETPIQRHGSEEKAKAEKPKSNNQYKDDIKITGDYESPSDSKEYIEHFINPSPLMDKNLERRYGAARKMLKFGKGNDTAYNAYINPSQQNVFATARSQISSMTMEECSDLQEKLSSVLSSMISNPKGKQRRNNSYSEKGSSQKNSARFEIDETRLIISHLTPKKFVPLSKEQRSSLYYGEGSFISSQNTTKLEHILQPIESQRGSPSHKLKDESGEKLRLNEISLSLRKMVRSNSHISIENQSRIEDTPNSSMILKGLKETSFQLPNLVDLNANVKLSTRRSREPHTIFRSTPSSPNKLKMVLFANS